MMKKVLALVVGLGLAAVVGKVTTVSAECPAHKTQAAVERADKEMAQTTAPALEKAEQVRVVQAEKASRPAPEAKK